MWWGWKESNLLPSGYEPPALTDELQPRIGYYTKKMVYSKDEIDKNAVKNSDIMTFYYIIVKRNVTLLSHENKHTH